MSIDDFAFRDEIDKTTEREIVRPTSVSHQVFNSMIPTVLEDPTATSEETSLPSNVERRKLVTQGGTFPPYNNPNYELPRTLVDSQRVAEALEEFHEKDLKQVKSERSQPPVSLDYDGNLSHSEQAALES